MTSRLRRVGKDLPRAWEIARRDGVGALGRRALSTAARRVGGDGVVMPLDPSDIADSATLPSAPTSAVRDSGQPLRIGWLTTPPSLGSGGHTTMFRMVEALEQAGHRCHLVLWDRHGGSAARHEAVIRQGWPSVRASVSDVSAGFSGLDACFATAWQTAHVLASRCTEPLARMYFVQDYEPYFYARGSEYALAEDTYRFGFHCFTIGKAVAEVLQAEHDVTAHVFDFGCDTDVYRLTNTGPRNGVVMYAKPDVPRRGYIHNISALAQFHRRHPEHTIHVFGHPTGDLPFPIVHHGMQTPAQLNDLYNATVTGLATSFTNMTLVTEEMLAAGNIPVINDTEIGRAGLRNDHIVWARPTPSGMADALCSVVESADQNSRVRSAAASVLGRTWTRSQQEFVSGVEQLLYAHSAL